MRHLSCTVKPTTVQACSSDPIPCHQPDISQLHNPIQSGIQSKCGPPLPSRWLTYSLGAASQQNKSSLRRGELSGEDGTSTTGCRWCYVITHNTCQTQYGPQITSIIGTQAIALSLSHIVRQIRY
ncbi:unnamed protein product [Ectocarpus sp. 8 AP-2014]